MGSTLAARRAGISSPKERYRHGYSALSVSAGSIRAIRSAGKKLAAAAIPASTSGTAVSVNGSQEWADWYAAHRSAIVAAAKQALCFADLGAPFFAGAKLPSIKASSTSSTPRILRSAASARGMFRMAEDDCPAAQGPAPRDFQCRWCFGRHFERQNEKGRRSSPLCPFLANLGRGTLEIRMTRSALHLLRRLHENPLGCNGKGAREDYIPIQIVVGVIA
jgi:hypothetical protein